MMNDVTADASHNEGGNGALAAVAYYNQISIFFFCSAARCFTWDAGCNDCFAGDSFRNLRFHLIHDSLCCFFSFVEHTASQHHTVCCIVCFIGIQDVEKNDSGFILFCQPYAVTECILGRFRAIDRD